MVRVFFSLLGLLLIVSPVFAQTPPASTPTAQDIETQMQQVGCNAERQAAAQTIVQLQKQIAELQKQQVKNEPSAPPASPAPPPSPMMSRPGAKP
jgi:hypothetical protein